MSERALAAHNDNEDNEDPLPFEISEAELLSLSEAQRLRAGPTLPPSVLHLVQLLGQHSGAQMPITLRGVSITTDARVSFHIELRFGGGRGEADRAAGAESRVTWNLTLLLYERSVYTMPIDLWHDPRDMWRHAQG